MAAGLISSQGKTTGVTENRDIFLSRSCCLFSAVGESIAPEEATGVAVVVIAVAEADSC